MTVPYRPDDIHNQPQGLEIVTHYYTNGKFTYIIYIFTYLPRSKPDIIMTGDDDSTVYLFEANQQSNTADWTYTRNIIFQANRGTVGAPAARDVDGDGNVEIFIPAYSDGAVHVMTYIP